MNPPRILVPALLCALFAIPAGCHYSNPHGSQALEPTKRLVTVPGGATVYLHRQKLRLEGPCDIPYTVHDDDRLTVSKDGYHAWTGLLGDLPQVAAETYEVRLQRKE